MSNTDSLLIEIRDQLKSHEAKYADHVRRMESAYGEQLEKYRRGGWAYIFWGIFVVAAGVYLGGVLLKLQGIVS